MNDFKKIKNIKYSGLSNYGHFMHEDYSMERLDKVDEIREYLV